jgi:tetratricopeptide (TPR) repeat protein
MIASEYKAQVDSLLLGIKADLESQNPNVRVVKLNSPVQRLKKITQLISEAKDYDIRAKEIYLTPRLSIMPQLDRVIQENKGEVDVIFVNGFDTAAQETPSEEHIAVILDQFSKDILRLPVPVVFWLPVFIVDIIYRKTPNFWRLISNNLFDLRENFLAREIDLDVEVETPEARSIHIQHLETQLDEIRQIAGRTSPEHAPILMLLAQKYLEDKQPEKAFEVYSEVLSLLDAGANALSRAEVLQRIGNIFHIWGIHDKAAVNFREALVIRRKLNDEHGLAETTAHLGSLYQDLGEFDKAIGFYEQSIELHKKLNNPEGVASQLLNWGIILEEVGLYARAVEKYREAFELYRNSTNYRNMGITLLHTAKVYHERDLEREAVRYYHAAESIFTSLHSPYRILVEEGLADIRQQLGDAEFEKALADAKRFTAKRHE